MTTSDESSDETAAEPPLIDIRRATIWRGSTRVFDDFDLTIRQHEQVAVLGPNGSGKTTLLKVVNREIYPVVQPDYIGLVSQDLQNRYRGSVRGLDVVVSGFLASVGVQGLLARRVTAAQP